MLGDTPALSNCLLGAAMSSSPSSLDYAGDIGADEAWEMLKSNPKAQLIDVRTVAEWNFVGLPDLAALERRVHCVEWQMFPSMARNSDFVSQASETLAGAGPDVPLLFLCRSGARSRSAARAMAQAGYQKAFNIAGGFEGDLNGERHRGTENGWKAAGLPWKQS